MKKLILGLCLLAVGCAGTNANMVVNTAFTVEQLACIIAADVNANIPAIMTICKVSEDLRPIVEQMVAGKKTAAKQGLSKP